MRPDSQNASITEKLRDLTVRANQIGFHVVECGAPESALVLLLHGFPDSAFAWRKQQPALARAGFRVWAPDLRGYDLTDKPPGVKNYHLNLLERDVKELIRAAGAEKATVIGHDWGAFIAWRFAMDYPEFVSKLVILNVPHPAKWHDAFGNPRQWARSWYIAFFQIPWLPEFLISHNSRRIAEGIRRSMVHKEAFTQAHYRTLLATWLLRHLELNRNRFACIQEIVEQTQT